MQSAAVNVLQSLAVSEVKKIADSLGADANRDGRLDKPTAATESVRAALQALTGCAGAAAGGSGSCSSAAMGAASSVVINYLLTSFVDPDPKDANGNPIPRSLEDQEARKNIVTTITPKASANFGKGNASGTDVSHIKSNLTAAGQRRSPRPMR